jgi:hypothetical protein
MLELVPPGRVIFLRPLKREGTRAAWDAVWVKAQDVIREVMTRLLCVHPGSQYANVCEQEAETLGLTKNGDCWERSADKAA